MTQYCTLDYSMLLNQKLVCYNIESINISCYGLVYTFPPHKDIFNCYINLYNIARIKYDDTLTNEMRCCSKAQHLKYSPLRYRQFMIPYPYHTHFECCWDDYKISTKRKKCVSGYYIGSLTNLTNIIFASLTSISTNLTNVTSMHKINNSISLGQILFHMLFVLALSSMIIFMIISFKQLITPPMQIEEDNNPDDNINVPPNDNINIYINDMPINNANIMLYNNINIDL